LLSSVKLESKANPKIDSGMLTTFNCLEDLLFERVISFILLINSVSIVGNVDELVTVPPNLSANFSFLANILKDSFQSLSSKLF